MTGWEITDNEIEEVEKILIGDGHFQEDAREVIRCWKSTEVSACPGSGKTTVLLAKLKLIADRMPLENGAGICVLSHTNVAVDEIREKLSDCSSMLMGYPNYIGTIQSFVDQFVTFPYLRNVIKEPLQVMDNDAYAGLAWREICKSHGAFRTLYGLLYNKVKKSSGKYTDERDFLARLIVKDDGIYNREDGKRIAKNEAESAKQYVSLRMGLLQQGYLMYEDSFKYAEKAINHQKILRDLFSLRFRYVFIDEFQDCNESQRKVIDLLFDQKKTTVIKIGEPDQAIYDNSANSEDWVPGGKVLAIESSNRYSQEIADVLKKLKRDGESIHSTVGYVGIKPHIIVYDEDRIEDVIPTFSNILKEYGMTSGNHRMIGRIKNGKGIRLSSYWSGYNGNIGQQDKRYYILIDEIAEKLGEGCLYEAEVLVRQLISQIFGLLNIRDDEGKKLTISSLKRILDEEYFDIYRGFVLDLVKLDEYVRHRIDNVIRSGLNRLCEVKGKDDIVSKLPEFYMEDSLENNFWDDAENNSEDKGRFDDVRRSNKIGNVLDSGGVSIYVNTIHKEKGRTHDATLYVETERRRQSDILQIMPFIKGVDDRRNGGKGDDYVRRCAYVGFSRARKLLCVAMRRSTYNRCKDVFAGWKIVECSESDDYIDSHGKEVKTRIGKASVSCVSDLNPLFDDLQLKHGDPSLSSIYNGGCEDSPDIAFVFMNPTGRNIASRRGWTGIRSPWIGTKQIWRLFSEVRLLSDDVYAKIRAYKPDQWTPDFAEEVYNDIAKHRIYITNFAKCTQSDAKKISNTVYREYLPLLEKEIGIVNPKAIVLFGTQVSTLFLDEKIVMADSRKVSFEKMINRKAFYCYPVFYPVGNGMHNIDKSIEDIKWILDRVRE